MKNKFLVILACAAVVMGGAVRADVATASTGASTDVLVVPHCAIPPVLDGMLDDACWGAALPLTGFTNIVLGAPGQVITNHAAYITYDEAWLYIAFNVRHPAPAAIRPKIYKHDQRIQGEDCVKVSFAAGVPGENYALFRLSAGNVRAEQYGGAITWNIPWRSATHISTEGWTVEIALPWCLLVNGPRVESCRLNFLVVTLAPEDVDEPDPELRGWRRTAVAWRPTIGTTSYAPQQEFAFQEFAVRRPSLPLLEQIVCGGYVLDRGRLLCTLRGNVREYGGTQGVFKVTVSTDANTADAVVTGDVQTMAGEALPLELVTPIVGRLPPRMSLALIEPSSGECWQRVTLDEADGLSIFSAYPRQNYFSAETNAVILTELRFAGKDLADLWIAAKDHAGRTLAGYVPKALMTELALPLAQLPFGVNFVRMELLTRQGDVLGDQDLTFRKLVPKLGHEVKIDHQRRVALVEDQPFFPVGFWYMGGNFSGLEEIARTGFNTVVFYPSSTDAREQMLTFLDAAHSNGLYVLPSLECFGVPHESRQSSGLGHLKAQLIYSAQRGDATYAQRSRAFQKVFEENLPAIEAGINLCKNHPALLAWYTFDEPPNRGSYALFRQGRALTQLVNVLDGYHPVWMQGLAGVKIAPEDTDWCDIIGHDPYWVPGHPNKGDIAVVWRLTQFVRRVADEERKPTWMILEGENIADTYMRYLSPQEQRCQTYLALIGGARGLIYYFYPIRFQAMWMELCRLAKEIQVLAPAILSQPPEQQIDYSIDNKPVKDPPAPALLLAHAATGLVLLCANSKNYPVQLTCQLASLPTNAFVKDLFSDQCWSVVGNTFTDVLAPLATRAYQLPAGIALPVQIALRQQPFPEQAAPKTAALLFGESRVGVKNLKPNPSFEDASNPGWPDYYAPPWFVKQDKERIGLPDCPYALDTDNPWHGNVSLRVETRNINGRPYYGVTFFLKHPGPLNMSFYARAAKQGVKMTVYVGERFFPIGPLTKAWERYSVNLPQGIDYSVLLQAEVDATIWLDAIQIETGSKATEFEP